MKSGLSRRQFAARLGAGVGAGLGMAGPFALTPVSASLPADAPPDSVQLNSNENPYGPSPRALEALTRAQHTASRYPDAAERRLLDALGRLHGVAPDQIVLGCGSSEVLQMAGMAFLAPGRTIVACEPTFEAVLGYARVTRADAKRIPQTADFRHDLAAMLAACDAATGLVYVCNPNNPTGTLLRRDELAFLLERVPRTAMVLLDEAYHHFVEDKDYASGFAWLAQRPNLVVVRTFSKIFGLAGMRLGYAAAGREAAAALRAHASRDNVNGGVLEAALASLGDEEHAARQRALNRDTREWLCRELSKDGRRYIPSHANFLMIELGRDAEPVITAFREKRILVGRPFPSMPRWLRVSIGTAEEMRRFLDALRAIVPAA
jgi:histidinol-phosphate aminotransferase